MCGFARARVGYADELRLNLAVLAEFVSAVRAVFGIDSHAPGGVALGDVARRRGFVPPVATIAAGLSGGFSSGRRSVGQQRGTAPTGVGENSRADQQREALGAFGAAALHAATAQQHRDAPLDAGAKALALLECRRFFVGLALRRFAAAPLWNAHDFD